MIYTDNSETLKNALAKIEELEELKEIVLQWCYDRQDVPDIDILVEACKDD